MFRLAALVCLLSLFYLTGCGHKITALVNATAEVNPMPENLTWLPVIGAGEPFFHTEHSGDTSLREVTNLFAGALHLYQWRLVDRPEQADVVIRMTWEAKGPRYVWDSFSPSLGTVSSGFGFGSGRPRWRNRFGWGGPYDRWRGRTWYPYASEPSLSVRYLRTFRAEAILLKALSPAIRKALLPAEGENVSPASGASQPSPAALQSKKELQQPQDLSRPPYAPPLFPDGDDSFKQGQPPFAPPILPEGKSIPPDAVLWVVEVSNNGSSPDTQALLPQMAAAAVRAIGKNMIVPVSVDKDLQVTFQANP